MDWSTKVESIICALLTGFMTKVSFVISYLHEKKKKFTKHGKISLWLKGENIALEIIDIFVTCRA